MNWAKMIMELQQQGLTESAIAMLVGTTQPTISRIKNHERRVYWDVGQRLIAIHGMHKAEHMRAKASALA